jgi:riboflavin synthase
MFTGIIRSMGRVVSRVEGPAGHTFTISAPGMARRLAPGDSIAISGACMTVESVAGDTFAFTAVGESLIRTTLGNVDAGSPVNLEPAATPETALGGHIVQGHVDGVGRVVSFERVSRESTASGELSDRLLTVELPAEVFVYAVEKGSIAIDGISLTIAGVGAGRTITITIVPYTLQETNVSEYKPGTPVNVEVDIVAKYVRHYLMNSQQGNQPMSGGQPADGPER